MLHRRPSLHLWLQVKLVGVMVIEAKSNMGGMLGIQLDLFANKGLGEAPLPAAMEEPQQQQPEQQPQQRRKGRR